jgi:hypothetical protein
MDPNRKSALGNGALVPASSITSHSRFQCPLPWRKRTFKSPTPRSAFDPNVWSGRALQVDFAELAVGGLASMYPAFDWSVMLRAIMDVSARAISLADRPLRAIRVTSVRMRREDRTSISSHPLADLGR